MAGLRQYDEEEKINWHNDQGSARNDTEGELHFDTS
jgi:hypothetical protein